MFLGNHAAERARKMEVSFTCRKCGASLYLPENLCKNGFRFRCEACLKRYMYDNGKVLDVGPELDESPSRVERSNAKAQNGSSMDRSCGNGAKEDAIGRGTPFRTGANAKDSIPPSANGVPQHGQRDCGCRSPQWVVALILCALSGMLGGHLFYAKRVREGIGRLRLVFWPIVGVEIVRYFKVKEGVSSTVMRIAYECLLPVCVAILCYILFVVQVFLFPIWLMCFLISVIRTCSELLAICCGTFETSDGRELE